MWHKYSLKICLVVALLGMHHLQATSIITTASGGNPKTGYKGSAVAMTSGDVIRGFVMFKDGFSVPNDGTVFYDAEGPIFGEITFGNSSSVLQLGSDLRLGGTGSCWQVGSEEFAPKSSNISGRGHSTLGTTGGNTIYLGGDVSLSRHVSTISSNLIIDGCGHTLSLLDSVSTFSMDSNVTLTLKNMNLVLTGSSTPFHKTAANTGSFQVWLENMNVYCENVDNTISEDYFLFGDAGANKGTTTIQGLVSIHGPYLNGTHVVKAASRSTASGNGVDCNIFINANSTLYLGPGVIFNLDGLNVANAKKIGMYDVTSRLVLDGCTLRWKASTTSGNEALQLQRGSVYFDDKVVIKNFENDGTTTNANMSNGLIFGDGSSSTNDVDVRLLGGAYVVLQGCMQYKHS